ncbi:MAG: DUF3108 domain-containing protein [Ramlibacter sp.]
MASRATLSWLLLAGVLLAHWLALEWVARQVQIQPALRLLAAPMLTRLLEPKKPLPMPFSEGKVPPVRAARLRSAIEKVESTLAATETAQLPPVPEPQAATNTATVASPQTVTAAAAEPMPSTVAVTPTAAPDTWPADTRLTYDVGGNYRGELHGDARVQWQREGSRYQTRVDISVALLSFYMTSQGEVTPQGLLPRAYEEQRNSKRRNVQMDETTITFADGSKAPRPDGVQDTASQFVELSHRFAGGIERLEVGRSISFWLARPGGADLWTYDIAARETLQTPKLGAVEAFHLKPRPLADPRGNISAEMWFAPSLQYLPVRIKVSMGDDIWVDLMVEKIEQR